MEDVQSHAPLVALNIDRVGVRELRLPLLVRDRTKGTQQTVASVDLGVDLPSAFKGTHMSRFVEALEQWNDEISYQSVRRLLVNIKERLGARRAYARFCFPYFIVKKARRNRASARTKTLARKRCVPNIPSTTISSSSILIITKPT